MINKEKKTQIVKDLTDKLSKQKSVVFFGYTGVKVDKFQELRSKLRESGIDCQVSKKTLIDLAAQKANLEGVDVKNLSGQVALAAGYDDEVAPAKIVYDFAKNCEEIKILAGLIQDKWVGADMMCDLAKLPSKPELLAKVVGSISSPLYGLANALQYNMRKFVFVLKNLELKEE